MRIFWGENMVDASGLLYKLNNEGFRYYYNLDSSKLVDMSVSRGETDLRDSGAILLNTSPHTGRAAQDRFLVRDQTTVEDVHWSDVNKSVEASQFELLMSDVEEDDSGDLWNLMRRVVAEVFDQNVFAPSSTL